MKRLLLVASLPLPLAGCSSKTTNDSWTVYVDSRGFDDGGDQEACLAAGCGTWPDGPYCSKVSPFDLGVEEVVCGAPPGGGRRPEGFDAIVLSARDEVGEWLARTAALEAASVPAFRILAAELRAHGAPDALVEAARSAAEQETRHARAMMRLAHRHSGTAMSFAIAARPVRALEAIAMENAVEGCVREAFGAVLAFEQARNAADADVRAEFAVIAPEEMGHARLSGAVHSWARGKLSQAGRRRVDEARAKARMQLARDLESEPSQVLREVVGLPGATRAQDLVSAL